MIRFLWAARLCFAGAIAVATWLLIFTLTEKPMAGCGPGSSCDRVMGSAWAYWLDIPVSAPALAVYATLLICSIAVSSKNSLRRQRAWTIGFIASILILAVASWFVYLQLNVIKSVCKYCTSSHVLSLIGAILFLAKAPQPPGVSQSRKGILALVGLFPFAALVTGQQLAPHKTNVVRLYRGSLRYDLRDVPLIGSPDAKAFIVELFDYTCPDCQQVHGQLAAARAQLTNSFSIICLPCPLDANCNPQVKRTPLKHTNACEYAKIGLAMRRCGSDLFQQYDDWYFGLGKTPPLPDAREKAIALAGRERFDNAIADPWISQTLQKGFSLYQQSGAETKSYRIPQLFIGDRVNTGSVRNVDELVRLLTENLPALGKSP